MQQPDPENATPKTAGQSQEPPPLDGWVRTILLVLGSMLVAVGLVGLALPVIPQTIPLALGAAMLSLGSERLHRSMLSALSRWPAAARLLLSIRSRLHRRLDQLSRRSSPPSS